MEERDSERTRLGWHEEIDRTRGVVILLQCDKNKNKQRDNNIEINK